MYLSILHHQVAPSRSGVPGLGFLGVPGSVCSEQCVRILSQPEVLAEAPRLKFPS